MKSFLKVGAIVLTTFLTHFAFGVETPSVLTDVSNGLSFNISDIPNFQNYLNLRDNYFKKQGVCVDHVSAHPRAIELSDTLDKSIQKVIDTVYDRRKNMLDKNQVTKEVLTCLFNLPTKEYDKNYCYQTVIPFAGEFLERTDLKGEFYNYSGSNLDRLQICEIEWQQETNYLTDQLSMLNSNMDADVIKNLKKDLQKAKQKLSQTKKEIKMLAPKQKGYQIKGVPQGEVGKPSVNKNRPSTSSAEESISAA